jgi:hypothetical protein
MAVSGPNIPSRQKPVLCKCYTYLLSLLHDIFYDKMKREENVWVIEDGKGDASSILWCIGAFTEPKEIYRAQHIGRNKRKRDDTAVYICCWIPYFGSAPTCVFITGMEIVR